MGKPFPCDQQTPQAVHEQKLLEEYDLSNALRAYGETQDCNLKSGRSGSVCAPANGNQRTPLKNPRRQSSSKKARWKEAPQSHSPSVRFMLSMLPRTVETGIMKIHITSFWVPNPGGLTLKCQVFLCVSFKYFVYFSMLGLRSCSYLILFIFACIYLKKKEISKIFVFISCACDCRKERKFAMTFALLLYLCLSYVCWYTSHLLCGSSVLIWKFCAETIRLKKHVDKKTCTRQHITTKCTTIRAYYKPMRALMFCDKTLRFFERILHFLVSLHCKDTNRPINCKTTHIPDHTS